MRLAVISHHGRAAAGAEYALKIFIDRLPKDIEPHFFLFEDGEFAEHLRREYGRTTILPMSARVATSTRDRLKPGALIDSLRLSARLARELKTAKVDAALTNSMKSHVIGSLGAKMAGVPCVNFVHDLPDGAARFVLREASRLFATERLACAPTVARNLALPRTTVVYTPLELERYRAMPPAAAARAQLGIPDDGRAVVGLVGRVARWKGQDRFVRIASEVRKAVDAHYVIVGSPLFGCDEGYFQELVTLVENLGMRDRVHFVPWQSDPTPVYAALDVLCNCSQREPFARTVCEAMASHVPVVCFDDSGICGAFARADGVTPIPAGDDSAYVRALATICDDVAQIDRLGAAALRAAQRLDADVLARDFAHTLYRAAARKRVRRRTDPQAATARVGSAI